MMMSDTMTEEDRGILRDRIAQVLSEIWSDRTGYKVTMRFVHKGDVEEGKNHDDE